jgi:hypothetical protein
VRGLEMEWLVELDFLWAVLLPWTTALPSLLGVCGVVCLCGEMECHWNSPLVRGVLLYSTLA